MLTKSQVKNLEKKYGKHNFCYECGNPNLIQCEPFNSELKECPKCGSSDMDE
jgi:ribosomal protein L37AE/L43A